MHIFSEILRHSKDIDSKFSSLSYDDKNFQIELIIPQGHPRYHKRHSYMYNVGSISDITFEVIDLVLIDSGIPNFHNSITAENKMILEPVEHILKNQTYINSLIDSKPSWKNAKKLYVIGGGVLLNVGGYIAEQLELELIYIPTTLISMSDSSIGGKVRMNLVDDENFHKHFYKSYYEPDQVILDQKFLDTIPKQQISVGMAEIVKHGIYQSEELLSSLLSDDFQPYNVECILHAILWTVSLKKVCLDLDPEETESGSYTILRGGHDLSDKIEEASDLQLAHGMAVYAGILDDVQTKLVEKEEQYMNLLSKWRIREQVVNVLLNYKSVH